MKRFSIIALICSFLPALSSCVDESGFSSKSDISISIEVNDVITKSFIDYNDESGEYESNWTHGDKLGILADSWKEDTELTTVLSNTLASGKTARFDGSISLATGSHTLYGVCPSTCIGKVYNSKCIGLDVPSVQKCVEGSFDPKSDVLVAKPKTVEVTSGQTALSVNDMQFARLSSVVKLVVFDNNSGYNLSSDKVISISLSVPEETQNAYFAGRIRFDCNSLSYALVDGTGKRSVTVAPSSPYALSEDNAAYISVVPGTIASGVALTVHIVTDNHNIKKTITLANPIVFNEGKMTVLKVGITDGCEISDKEAEPITEGWHKVLYSEWLNEGDKVVITSCFTDYTNKAVGSYKDKYFGVADVTLMDDGKSIEAPSSSVSVFSISSGSQDGSVSLKAVGSDEKYVSYTGAGTAAYVSYSSNVDDSSSWVINFGSEAVAYIANVAYTNYFFQHNTSGRFAAYKNTQKNLYLYKYYAGAPKADTPEIVYNNGSVVITCQTEGATIYYTLDGTEPSEDSAVYSREIDVPNGATVKAIASAPGRTFSLVAFLEPAATPELSCSKNVVSINGSGVKYTIDGSAPSTLSSSYSDPFSVSYGVIVKAYSTANDKPSSSIVEMVPCAAPVITQDGNCVNILAEGLTIYYSTNGADVDFSGEGYSSPVDITLTANTTIKAVAVSQQYTPSLQVVKECSYVAMPTIITSNITGVSCLGTQDGQTSYTIQNFTDNNDDVSVVSVSGCVDSADAEDGLVCFSVKPNYATSGVSGSIVLGSVKNNVKAVINITQSPCVFEVTADDPFELENTASSSKSFTVKSSFAGILSLEGDDADKFTLSADSFEANTSDGICITITATDAGASTTRSARVIVAREGGSDATINITQKAIAPVGYKGTLATWGATSAFSVSDNTVYSKVSTDHCGVSASLSAYNGSTKLNLAPQTIGSGASAWYVVYYSAAQGSYWKITLPITEKIAAGTKIKLTYYSAVNSKGITSWTATCNDEKMGDAISVVTNGSPSVLSDMSGVTRELTLSSDIDAGNDIVIKIVAGNSGSTKNCRISQIQVTAE